MRQEGSIIELSNKKVSIRLDEPGVLYTGTRFDHSGYLYSMVMGGTEFCAKEFPEQTTGIGGAGLCSEFGIFHPPGFDETPIGGWYLKPGVGLLKKTSERYSFQDRHECQFDRFEVEYGPRSVRISSEGQPVNGYRLKLDKVFELTDDGVAVRYELENTGSKTIHTEEYVHNFIAIGGRPIGPGYSFNFEGDVAEGFSLPAIMVRDGDQYVFRTAPEKAFYFRANPRHLEGDGFDMSITHRDVGRFREAVDFTPSMIAVWGCPHALSVELFKQIDLPPGERLSYQRAFKAAHF